MKNMIALIGIILVSVVCTIPVSLANVGIGMSPTKLVLQGPGGTVQTSEILVFNPGDEPLEISLHAEGDIAAFTTFSVVSALVDPEPQPHALPIKNGKTITAIFKLPPSSGTKTFTGMISATGGPIQGKQFGGTVGVASAVTYTVTPPPSVLSFITKGHLITAATIIIILSMIIILRKKGLRLTFQKQE